MKAKAFRILVVEDEADLRELMCLHLNRSGYQVLGLDNGEDALQKVAETLESPIDLAVVDWMLPGTSGLELCTTWQGKFPILMVTARADTQDIVLGLEKGADDYVCKPFEIPVFLARVAALLRRNQSRGQANRKIEIESLVLDPDSHCVSCQSQEVHLTPSEFKLLHALMIHQGKVLSRDRLIELVQGEGVIVVDRAIDTHVFGLRKKLGPCADVIETIRGIGYRIAVSGGATQRSLGKINTPLRENSLHSHTSNSNLPEQTQN